MTRLPGALRSARMVGSSIATPGAAGWVTDFLNAAYYAHPESTREVRSLRLAHGVITTYWTQIRGRIGARHLLAFNRVYGARRRRNRGRLGYDDILAGANQLFGDWFAAAWADDDRRAHGIAFETVEGRDLFDPSTRQRHAALKDLTPPRAAPAEQEWATYGPVALADPDAALAFLNDPARWPDMGCSNGRFTAVRPGGLEGQTFEIEVVAALTPRSPVFTRGYVTCTALHTAGSGLDYAVDDLRGRYAAGTTEDHVVFLPDNAEPIALVTLTTHEGHFLGRALSNLLVWRDSSGVWIRDVGSWDPLPRHLAVAYAAAGREAQHQFWGPEPQSGSMLAQLALVTEDAQQ